MPFQMHVSIPYFTSIPEDVCTNVWSFSFFSLNPGPSDWNNLQTRLRGVYAAIYANTGSTLAMANYADPTKVIFKGYDLSDPTPRAPRHSSVGALTGVTPVATTLPSEAAVCASFQGALASGTPQSRRRGRIYLGCLGTVFTSSSTSTFPELSSVKRAGVNSILQAFNTAVVSDGWTWCVWSRTDQALVPITNGWIDNAPDTQRRRGQGTSARSVWP